MQRRAAAVYFVLFVLIGAGAYAFIQVGTTQPHVDLPGEALSTNGTIEVNGQTYSVSEIARAGGGGGGHGGGGGEGSIEGVLTWTNESAISTAALANNSTTSYEGDQYRVIIENSSDVSSFDLLEAQNVSAILASDSRVDNETVQRDGEPHVVYRSNQSLRPLDEYLPEPETAGPFQQGEQFPHQVENESVDATIESVNASAAVLAWNSPAQNEIDLTEGGNVTLGGQAYFVHFPDENSVQILSTDEYYGDYQNELATQDYWFERHAGLWGVVLISFLAAVFLLAAAYMPVRG